MEETNVAAQTMDLKKLSLKELEMEKIEFGKAKLGMPFTEAFKDHKWTEWFIRQYENSPKLEHQKYVLFVEKKLDEEIKEEKSNRVMNPKKTAASSEKSWDHVKEELEEEFGEEWDQGLGAMPGVKTEMAILQDQVNHMFQENQNMNHRMSNLEGNMAEILMHLKNLSVHGSQ